MGRKKILLVGDSSIMLLLERLVLDSSGYQILTAGDGPSGVRAALAQAAQDHRHRPAVLGAAREIGVQAVEEHLHGERHEHHPHPALESQ